MRQIWYLLKYQVSNKKDYLDKSPLMGFRDIEEILCFQYQRMMRYGGTWHLERRMVLPGYIFVSGSEALTEQMWKWSKEGKRGVLMAPCEVPYLKAMCQDGSLIGMSRGIIKNGVAVVTSGPLKGRERLIQRIDRHKRTAEIEIPLSGDRKRVIVGLEIYEKVKQEEKVTI